MDAKYYDSPQRPFFNKDSYYPDGFAPESYLLSYALQIGSSESELLKIGCGWSEHLEKLMDHYEKVYSVDTDKEIMNDFKEHSKIFANVLCSLSDGESLPYYDSFFDVVISQRGALLNKRSIFMEATRVLKPGGYLLATFTGEEDMLELKKSFGRGENFFDDGYVESVGSKLQDYNHTLGDKLKTKLFKEFRYNDVYHDLNSFVKMLEILPVIPDFNVNDPADRASLVRYIEQNHEGNDIVLHRQAFFWTAIKKF